MKYVELAGEKPGRFYPATSLAPTADRFAIEARPSPYSLGDGDPASIEFRVFEAACCDAEGGNFEYATGLGFGREFSSDTAGAAVFVQGHVKWDGCSNWTIQEDGGAMLHFCGREQMSSLGELFDRIYDIAADMMPSADFEKRPGA